MKILVLTDIHAKTGAVTRLDSLRQADLVLLSGDITHFGHSREMAIMLQAIRSINPAVYAVTGNCDYPDAEKYLMDEGISLNATFREFGGVTLFGLSGSLPCPGKTPHEYSEEEYEAIHTGLAMPQNGPLLFISHQPPYGTINDQVSPGVHVGSKTIRNFIEVHQPLICFTGHIHEGIGMDQIGTSRIVNPGPANAGGYAWAEIEGTTIKKLEITQPFR